MKYTNIQNGFTINGAGPITGITTAGSLSSSIYTIPTESVIKSYAETNFLSANTATYTQAQANANFLSANTTAFYTSTQANANFLSANTSYYTQVQNNANFLSANTLAYGSLTLVSGSFSHTDGTSTPLAVKSSSLTAGATKLTTVLNTTGLITISGGGAGYYLIRFSLEGTSTTYNAYLYKNGNTSLCITGGNSGTLMMCGSVIVLLAANDTIGIYTSGAGSSTTIYGYSLTVTRIGL